MEPLPTTIPTITSIQVENYSILQNSETEVLGDQRKRDNEENRRHEEEDTVTDSTTGINANDDHSENLQT